MVVSAAAQATIRVMGPGLALVDRIAANQWFARLSVLRTGIWIVGTAIVLGALIAGLVATISAMPTAALVAMAVGIALIIVSALLELTNRIAARTRSPAASGREADEQPASATDQDAGRPRSLSVIRLTTQPTDPLGVQLKAALEDGERLYAALLDSSRAVIEYNRVVGRDDVEAWIAHVEHLLRDDDKKLSVFRYAPLEATEDSMLVRILGEITGKNEARRLYWRLQQLRRVIES